ncbi:hypothetical protein NQ315_001010 [Exocentrus adspersus]|uniref:Uncharacterized protein n=1 Tax=Exocentrus adspersus TaxID=1586481 RepID=A0AAV8WFC5_9CUCU|nr:hypothetical protein NQ315_001010 [Exocentrus adspersus]
MFHDVRVTYPKKRKPIEDHVIEEIQEPARKTMYDVVLENFRVLKRVSFVHRTVYIGEHQFFSDSDRLEDLFSSTIQAVNEAYTAEKLTGFLLCYTKYFLHLVEGDEDSIYKHLGLLMKKKERATHLGAIKLLVHVSHVSKRVIQDWTAYVGTPSQYLGKINIDCELEEAERHIYNCIRKMYNLVFAYVHQNADTPKYEDRRLSMFTQEDLPPDVTYRVTRGPIGGVGGSTDPYRSTLPEHEIVDFNIKTRFTQDIEAYYGTYGVVPQRIVYNDKTWPCAEHHIQFDVFSKPFDLSTEFPKPFKSEDTKETKEVNEETVLS